MSDFEPSCTAFEGDRLVASGAPHLVAEELRQRWSQDPRSAFIVLDDASGGVIDIDPRPPVASDHKPAPGPGRPRLGVTAREVTLLPRHWEWLGRQPGGVSASLRRLVDAARKEGTARDRVRHAQEAAFRVMDAMAGDRPGFEEALRALFAGDRARFLAETASWPDDLRGYLARVADGALPPAGDIDRPGPHL